MGKEVFNRYEYKYLIDSSAFVKIQNRLEQYMELDEFNKNCEFYTICNIYYDTEDNYLIRTSLSKPKYKEKLRLRGYGIPSKEDKVYLEIKKKYCGLVNKRRTNLKLKEAYEFVKTGIQPSIQEYMNPQVLKEIEYVLRIYNLSPKVYLAYDRKAYFSKENRDLRITFDTNIRTRRYDLQLEFGDYGEKLLDEDKWLMEIKAEKSMPIWLTKMLSEYKVYKKSFSKYGTEHNRMIAMNRQRKGDETVCLKPSLMPAPQLIPQYR